MNKKDIIQTMQDLYPEIDKEMIKSIICQSLNISYTDFIFKDNYSDNEVNIIVEICKRMNCGEPLSLILGMTNFYGLDFIVNGNVLCPRPDTEVLVDYCLNACAGDNIKVLDLCTGSGAIAITIKKNKPQWDVDAIDISDLALEVAKKNASKHNVKINFIKSDMFSALIECNKYDIILSNPPYIETEEVEKMREKLKHIDPVISLDGGKDGLDFYKSILCSINKYLARNGTLVMEIGYKQGKAVQNIFEQVFDSVEVKKDNGNRDRIVICKNLKGVCYD